MVWLFYKKISADVNHQLLERLLCPICLGNEKPLKPATIALKIGYLFFIIRKYLATRSPEV